MKDSIAFLTLILTLASSGIVILGRPFNIDYSLGSFTSPINRSPESYFAINEKVHFSEVGIYELELIPRISDKLAISIIENKKEILRRAAKFPLEPERAFEIVHGVGPRVAKKLGNYLVLK